MRFPPAHSRILILAAALGCGESDPPTFNSTPEATIAVAPATLALITDAQFPFQALVTGPPGQDGAVVWSVEDTTLATVSAAGVVHASPCYRGGRTLVVATLQSRPSVRGAATLDVFAPAVALVAIQFLREPGSGEPVSLAAAGGEVEVGGITAPGACTAPATLALRVRRAGQDTVVAMADVGAAAAPPYLLRWVTDVMAAGAPVFPNDDYALTLEVTFTSGLQAASQTVPVRVMNP